MVGKQTRSPLRPLAIAALFLAASSVLLSAAQIGSPKISGYGIDQIAGSSIETANR